MNLKSLFLAAAVVVSAAISVSAQGKTELGPIEYREPVSGTVLKFDKAVVSDSSRYDYRKAVIYTEGSTLTVWSAPNPEEKAFDWKKINEFDANNRFGVMTFQEKIENAEGWLRHYNFTDKQNRKWAYCVALIRGNAHALYLVESAVSEESLILADLIRNTDFGDLDDRALHEKKALDLDFWLAALVALLLAGLDKLFFREKHGVFWAFGGVVILAFGATVYWGMLYSVGIALVWSFFLACLWVGVWLAESWTDFYNFVSKALNKA